MKIPDSKFQIPNSQLGQTLIETLAAIFILVTTLTVGLGLAVYTTGNSQNSITELTAVNLARQGIEVIRMMRDTNWLAGDATNASGFDLENCADVGSQCYPKVFTGPVVGNPQFANNFDLSTPSNPVCNLSSTNCSHSVVIQHDLTQYSSNTLDMFQLADSYYYALYLWPSGKYWHNPPSPCDTYTECLPAFLRKVKLTRINTAPYSADNCCSNWELVVDVYVTWPGKRCTALLPDQDPETLVTPCKVVLEERLTNWKDYR